MRDTIYRDDAIKAVWKPQVKPNELIFDALKRAIESEINNLPSADRPRGEWIATTMVDCGAPIWLCSMCEYESYGTYNFCPSCGARMKGADDE